MSARPRLGAVLVTGVLTAGALVLLADAPAAFADERTVVLVAPGTTSYGSPNFEAVVGGAVYFTSADALTGDDDLGGGQVDVYRRTGDTIELLTPGTDLSVA